MGLGAAAGNCSTGSGNHEIRYGMTIDVVQGGSTIPVAVDLAPATIRCRCRRSTPGSWRRSSTA
jgi:hypothetical protein